MGASRRGVSNRPPARTPSRDVEAALVDAAERVLVRDGPDAVTVRAVAIEAGVPFSSNRVGGMFGLFFTAEKVETYAQAVACDVAAFNRFFHAMLKRGVYLAPSAFEAAFMSSAHSEKDIADTLQAARAAFLEMRHADAP